MQRTAGSASAPPTSAAQGFIVGLAPVGLLALVTIAALALTALVRALTSGLGFSTQQTVALVVLIVGLIAGAAVYTVTGVRVLRRVAGWQQAGMTARASGALWGLVVGALVVLLPLLLAIVVPQHPAPLLAR